MAARSVKSPRGRKPAIDDFDEDTGLADFLIRNRYLVGGVTAFAVAFAYVSANAIWYQPHGHGSAFFQTRPLVMPAAQRGAAADGDVETVIRIERERDVAPPPAAIVPAQPRAPAPQYVPIPEPVEVVQDTPTVTGDPVVAEVQRILAGLNLYSGDVDGLTGPQTRNAIEHYRKIVGLTGATGIDEQLLSQLGARGAVASTAAPAASASVAPTVQTAPPVPQRSPGTDMIQTSSATPTAQARDAIVMRIQAGLKAFGNDGIEVDGVVGSRTKAAIIEFQSLFGLPETGEPNHETLAKMREIGLAD
jgi:peptidoglycan hydrolase-like protein with peptidoglycan-binding domain